MLKISLSKIQELFAAIAADEALYIPAGHAGQPE